MSKKYVLILLIFVLIFLAHHPLGYIGHYGYDDLHYAKLACDFKNGIIDFGDHYSYRASLILFTSLSYFLFGISDLTSSLPAILISVLILIILFQLLKNKGYKTLIIGLSLTTFSDWFIFYSDKLMPDIYISFSVLTALTVIHKFNYGSRKNRPLAYSILLSMALLFGFLSKGTIVLIIPVLVYYIILDALYKRNLKFWRYFFFSGSAILLLYFFIIWLVTGDFLKRFEAIANNSYINLCSYDKEPFGIVLERITFGFFELIGSQALATGFIFVVASLLGKGSLRYYLKLNDSFSFWMVSSVILLLSSNFMTISLTSYSPMCLDPRHYLFMVPVVSIPAATVINQYIERKTLKVQIILVLLLVSVISFLLGWNTCWKLYIPLTLLFILYFFIKPNPLNRNLFLLLFVVILSIQLIYMIGYAQRIKYLKQKRIFIEQVMNKNKNCLVITNDVQKRLAGYYSKFVNTNENEYVNYNEYKFDSLDQRKKLLFLNWYTRYLSGMDNYDLPFYARNISPDNTLIFEDKELKIAIYEMQDFSLAGLDENILLHTFNDFEKPVDNWHQNNEHITSEIKYAGENSIRVNEFSSTFEYPLDSLPVNDDFVSLLIECSLYCNYNAKTKSKLILSVENDEGIYIWKAMAINKYIKAYSYWWPIKFDITINQKELKANSRLKVYLWNVDKKIAYIDNFEIRIFKINNSCTE